MALWDAQIFLFNQGKNLLDDSISLFESRWNLKIFQDWSKIFLFIGLFNNM